MIVKQIHGQDAYYKLSAKNSGETSLNLSNELLQFIAPDLAKGEERLVSFVLNREDYLKALGHMFNKSPLYISSSTDSTKVDGEPSQFAKDFKAVCDFFGANKQKEYTVNMLHRQDDRAYLNSLEDKDTKFNLRHFLIEDNSTLIFEKRNNDITITLKTGDPSYIIKEKGVNTFAREVCLFFYKYDGFSNFVPLFKTSQAGYIQLENQDVTLSRFLNPNIEDSLKGKKWFNDIFEIEGQHYLLCSEWTANKNSSSVPSLEDFGQIVKSVYDGNFIFTKDDGYFIMKDIRNSNSNITNLPLQRIFYGAPGTGKSNTIKREVEDQGRAHFRTTFHPDSDYSTFVGCYKPTMVEAPVRDGSGHEVANAKLEEKNRISYSFVPQAFAKAYCEAWNKYGASENAEPVFLIIEEINRGNCAQIFGDIFQLLDREIDGARCGFSTYPIDADEDLKAFLEVGTKKDGSQWLTNKEGIKDGKLCLPPNLYIWATMNTSDQSLFPIDSAFKRRWDWKYMPINTKKENWTIKTASKEYSWSSFLEKINEEIDSTTHSEDKMLGFYFCRANSGVIDADKFVSKVLFYIYNDVFKDYGFDREMFKDEEGKVMSFKSYYKTDGTINERMVLKFLDNLKVKKNTIEDNANNDPNIKTE